MSLSAIIAAGGVGSRMGREGSKQLMELLGRPVLARTLSLFEGHPEVAEIIVAIEPGDLDSGSALVERFGFTKVRQIVPGGKSRAESVRNALAAIGSAAGLVLVHDGARPLFPIELLDGGLAELRQEICDGVVFGVPVTDTVKEVDAGRMILRTPERVRTWQAQTPQIFRRDILEQAYRMPLEVLEQATDDSMLVEIAGGRVQMVMGSDENIKLTRPIDLLLAEEILRNR